MLLIVDCLSDPTVDIQPVEEERLVGVVNLIEAARRHAVPLIIATREIGGSVPNLHAAIRESVRGPEIIECGSANPWEDDVFHAAVRAANRPRLIIAGRFTELCVTFTALSALEEGYDVYVGIDVTSGASREHHKTAISRMAQAGAVPVTSRQIIFEWQRKLPKTSEPPDVPES